MSLQRICALLLLVMLLSGCGALPARGDRAPAWAKQPLADSPLVKVARDSSSDPSLTGFRLLPDGFHSLDARIELVRRARYSLDLQYYLIQDDRTGRLLMRNLRDAALRGVRVRLLVDDLYTVGGDPMFRGLASFPNVEVRLFNPFCCGRQSVISKYTASLADFTRLNHRMHNKLFIADGAGAVMGGRNIADEYFARSMSSNFVDMDVFMVGPVVQKLASIFDIYWNSPQAYPVDVIIGEPENPEQAQRDFNRLVDDGEQMMSVTTARFDVLGYRPIGVELDAGRLDLIWGTAVVFADQPEKVMATSVEAARSMSVQMSIMDRIMVSKSEVLISSPYFIPGPMGVQAFDELRKRDVKVDILTNSLAANDEPLVHIGYSRYRVTLLRAGVDLYELSPTRMRRDERPEGLGASLGRLHAKTAVIDRSTVYMGSMNLDPRSESTNTEIGMLAECPELAQQVIRVINMSESQNAYRLRFAHGTQSVEWIATGDQGDVVFSQEPEVTPLMRLELMLLAPFVPEQLL